MAGPGEVGGAGAGGKSQNINRQQQAGQSEDVQKKTVAGGVIPTNPKKVLTVEETKKKTESVVPKTDVVPIPKPNGKVNDSGVPGAAAAKATLIALRTNVPMSVELFQSLPDLSKAALTQDEAKKLQGMLSKLSDKEFDQLMESINKGAISKSMTLDGKLTPEAKEFLQKILSGNTPPDIKPGTKQFDIFSLLLLLAMAQDKMWSDVEASLLGSLKDLVAKFEAQAESIKSQAMKQFISTCITAGVSIIGAAVNFRMQAKSLTAMKKAEASLPANATEQQRSAAMQAASVKSQAEGFKGQAFSQISQSVGQIAGGIASYSAKLEEAKQTIIRSDQEKIRFRMEQEKMMRTKYQEVLRNAFDSGKEWVSSAKQTGSFVSGKI